VFSHGVPFWSVALAGTQPLFDGITFYNKERSARAALPRGRRALSQYGSGRFPERGRHAARHKYGNGRAFDAATAVESAAKVTLGLTREQRRAGFVNGLVLLSAEQAYQQAHPGRSSRAGRRGGASSSLGRRAGGTAVQARSAMRAPLPL
jgi:hypothetical protein